jgi:nitrite reductase (NO-forming)
VRVSGAAPAAAAADEHADASLDDSAKLDPDATPPAAWRAYSPSPAPAPGGREHKVTLTGTEGVLEVAPGVEQQAWSFDGKVPGPALRGKVGELFTITLVNDPRPTAPTTSAAPCAGSPATPDPCLRCATPGCSARSSTASRSSSMAPRPRRA